MRAPLIAAPPYAFGDGIVAAAEAATQGCKILHGLRPKRVAVSDVVNLQSFRRSTTATAIAVADQSLCTKPRPYRRRNVFLVSHGASLYVSAALKASPFYGTIKSCRQ